MKKFIQKLKCRFGYHNFEIIQTFEPQGSCQIRCTECGRYFAINWSVRCILPWGPELERMYESFGNKLNRKIYT